MEKTPALQHIVEGRNHFTFSDVQRSVARAAADDNFGLLLPVPHKSRLKSFRDLNFSEKLQFSYEFSSLKN
jgi:hypothetical protein